MDNKPGYFAVIPAKVRYDKRLNSTAKLLYAEITCLVNKKGYCWATNKYFSELYEVSDDTIRRYLTQLEEAGYIRRVMIYKEDSKEILERRIYIDEIDTESNPVTIKPAEPTTNGDENEIFEYWNTKGLVKHKKINKNISEAISKALKEYEIDDILDAIDNYEEVVHDQTYFFDTIWPLDKFLKQQNALPEFLNEGAKWLSYANRKNGGVKGSFHSNGEQGLKFNTSNRRK